MVSFVKLREFLKLTRLDHGFVLSFAVFLAYLILGVDILGNLYLVTLSLLIPIFLQAGAFTLNDYLDYEADLANKRMDRPLINNSFKRETALYFSIAFFLLALVLSFFLPKNAFLIVASSVFLSLAYDIYLKHFPLIGNAVIALTMGLPFIYANAVFFSELKETTPILFGMAFIIGLAREIIKDIEDYEGDAKVGSKTLPILLGIKFSSFLSGFLLLLFLGIAIIPFIFYFEPTILSTLLLLFSYLLISYSVGIAFFGINEENFKERAAKIKNLLYIAMLIGLLSLAFLSLSI